MTAIRPPQAACALRGSKEIPARSDDFLARRFAATEPQTADRAAPIATLAQWWRDCCRARADQPALRHKQRGIWAGVTWGEYYEHARAIGLALADAGVQPGEVVSVLCENRPEWLFVDLGAQAMGFISHGLYACGPAAQVEHALRSAGTRAIVVEDADQLGKVLAVRANCPRLSLIVVIERRGLRGFVDPQVISYAELRSRGLALAKERGAEFERRIDVGSGEQIACLATTAGSTGPARLAAITHRSLLHQGRTAHDWLALHPGDRSLSFMSLAHVGERVLSIVAPLATQCLVHFPESAATVQNDLHEVRPQLVFAPPRFWEKLHAQTDLYMQEAIPLARFAYRRAIASGRSGWLGRASLHNLREALGLQHVRMAISGAAPVAAELLRWYRAIGVPMFESYGLTEASGFCAVVAPHPDSADEGFRPLADVRLQLAADGEILLRGPILHAGYWRDGAAHDAIGVDDWLHTGDFGVAAAGGGIRVRGRVHDRFDGPQGQPIEPVHFECAIKLSPYVIDAMLIGDSRRYCTCLVVLDEDSVGKYAQDHHIPYTDHASLATRPEVIELIGTQIDAANERLPAAERVQRFRILARPLTAGDEEVTPALRLRRHVVARNYAELVDEMYAG